MEIYLLTAFGIIFAIQIAFFIYAVIKKSDKVTDLAYGLTFVLMALLSFIYNNGFNYVLAYIPTFLVILWGIRLAIYLFIRIQKIGKDSRFDNIREIPVKFAAFWFLQSITIFIVLLPLLLVSRKYSDISFNYVSILFMLISIVGILIESYADKQKFEFKNDKGNKGKWVNIGLWKYSRHPNYLGEIMMWVGVFGFIAPFLSGWEFISVISPIYIIVLLLFVSGIPTLEKEYEIRFKGNNEYKKYKEKTGALFPKIHF